MIVEVKVDSMDIVIRSLKEDIEHLGNSFPDDLRTAMLRVLKYYMRPSDFAEYMEKLYL
jgi:hypothetical protein